MRRFRIIFVLLATLFLTSSVIAQYWFQFGARSGNSASQNNGASVEIQTIIPQNLTAGSLGFWVGEILSNGAFIQVGYLIENATGNYPALCTESGCSGYQYIKAGDAEWFYEYFPPNVNNGFFGAIGPDGSAGLNGTFHKYGFYSIGNSWYFTFDNNVIGSVNLGTGTSGPQVPAAFGELANTSNANTYIRNVIFSNLSVYKYGLWLPVADGYSYIGYGVGSEKGLKNPYGVKEIGNRINYFAVGSNLPQPPDGTQLWSMGYYLTIKSKYGNLNSTIGYVAYSSATITAPRYVYIAPGVRASFAGWIGKGLGSYTGPLNSTTINVNSNITETATWNIEYFLNVTSPYGMASGSGWYVNGSIAKYSIDRPMIYKNSTARYEFLGWSNGNVNATGLIVMNGPANLNALWAPEYLLSAKAPYGNVTGWGWYRSNTIVTLLLQKEIINQTPYERLAFYSWSNGNTSPKLTLLVDKPINLSAIYKKQYLIKVIGEDAYLKPIDAQSFSIDGMQTNGSIFLFANTTHKVDYAIYKGAKIISGYLINTDSPGTVFVPLSVYNVTISTRDIFGLPVNAYAELSFSNGSTIGTYTNGTLRLSDVPYGYANGTIAYLGIKQHVMVINGGGASLIFFSMLDIAVVFIVMLAIATAYFVGIRIEKKGKNAQMQKEEGGGANGNSLQT
ncbi:MAG: hypothetical protein ACP5GB_02225 [Candidatus Micrarchaeia archaeon]